MSSAEILIVEDDANSARELSGHLQLLGYGVCGVIANASQAIAQIKASGADLVLMNSRLLIGEKPQGAADSVDISTLMQPYPVPVILLVDEGDKGAIQRAARSAPHGYLIMPFQPRQLRAAVEVARCKSTLERRLRDSERWFTATLHCVDDGVIAVDADGCVQFLNLAAENSLGVTLENVQGKKIEEILHFEDTAMPSIAEVLRTGSTFGIDFGKWILNADSQRVAVDHSAAPVRDDNDALIGAVVVIRDAAVRIAAEDALRFSEDRFRTAFDHAPEGMALVTLNGSFVQGNAAIRTLLKCDDAELQSLNISDITPVEDHVAEKRRLTQLMAGNTTSLQFEHRILPRNGDAFWVQFTISLLRREDSPFCYLYQFHDLTAHKLAESLEQDRLKASSIHEWTLQEKLLAQAANQSKTTFIASMSHELRTPLNAILGFAQLLENEDVAKLTPDQRDCVQNIQRAGWHLLDLIGEVLDLGKIESGSLRLSIEDVDLRELLPDCIHFISTAAHEAQIVVAVTGEFNFMVKADRIRLRQVIINFLSNAVKYNRVGGEVAVTCTQHGDRVRVAVRDTGAGLTVEQKAHLFEPFNRLGKENGTIEGSGIGLVITKRLVESMDGEIGVECLDGSGCVFWIELAGGDNIALTEISVPLVLPSLPHIFSHAAADRTCTILCIEDNPVNMLLISRIVKQHHGWTLIAATTGESGFDLAVNSSPDLILLDISLPDVSGLDLIRRLRGNSVTQAIPIAAVSANAGPQYIEEALACGFDRYITKPIRLPEFMQTIESLLSESEPPSRGLKNEEHICQ